MTIILQGLIVF